MTSHARCALLGARCSVLGARCALRVVTTVQAELRDPYHMDFRPCPNSMAARLGVGAYPPWTATDAAYWIPGRREFAAASTPLPPDGAIGVHRNTELMFLPAIKAINHVVYFGAAGGPLQQIATLEGPLNNIASLPQPANAAAAAASSLETAAVTAAAVAVAAADTDYTWRVDTVTAGGEVHVGSEWHFTTGTNFSCAITPHPPTPGPTECAAAEEKWCPGDAHTGAQKGDKCVACVIKFSRELRDASCYQTGENGARHAFIVQFCGRSQDPHNTA